MERVYKMYHHPDMGYCAMLKTSFGWQQVSLWYASQGRLIIYWAKKKRFEISQRNKPFHGKINFRVGCRTI